jgi:hypothetical protein
MPTIEWHKNIQRVHRELYYDIIYKRHKVINQHINYIDKTTGNIIYKDLPRDLPLFISVQLNNKQIWIKKRI